MFYDRKKLLPVATAVLQGLLANGYRNDAKNAAALAWDYAEALSDEQWRRDKAWQQELSRRRDLLNAEHLASKKDKTDD